MISVIMTYCDIYDTYAFIVIYINCIYISIYLYIYIYICTSVLPEFLMTDILIRIYRKNYLLNVISSKRRVAIDVQLIKI